MAIVRDIVRDVVRDVVKPPIATQGGGSPPATPTEFTIVMRTTGASETVTLPITGNVDVDIDWGDGSSVEAFTTDTPSHVYATADDYTVKVTGSADDFAFNNGGDKDKLIEIVAGGTGFNCGSWSFGFRGCGNLVAADMSTANGLSGVDDGLANLFRDCGAMVSCALPTGLVAVGAALRSFEDCALLANDPGLSTWDVTGLTTANSLFNGADGALTTSEYDAILIAWEAQAVQDSVNIHFGDATYTSGGAADTARTALANDHSWTITDGGGV